MKKQTQILTLFHTANFIDENNRDGKVIDFTNRSVLELLPLPSLAQRVKALKGIIETTDFFTRIFLPLDFEQSSPAAPVALLPDNVSFFIRAKDTAAIKFSGLEKGKQLFFLSPSGTKEAYVFGKSTIQCTSCSKAKKVAAGDLVDHLPATLTLDAISLLTEQPIGTENKALDLKIKLGTTEYVIEGSGDLQAVQKALRADVYNIIPVAFHRTSDNSLLKKFTKMLITEGPLPPGVVGIVSIPVEALELAESDQKKFETGNQFVVHLPSASATVSLTLNTTRFTSGSKLLFDDKEVPGPVIQNHPEMPEYKKITATVSGYVPYLTKQKKLIIQTENRKIALSVDPLNHFDPKTKTANITITT